VTHGDIPDDPTTESERRQLTFSAAIGLQTCNIRREMPNRIMARLLSNTGRTRDSRRYPGYLRVRLDDYRTAALTMIEQDAPDLIEAFGLRGTLTKLRQRLADPDSSAASGRLTAAILGQAGARSPLQISGQEFNQAAETYYRDTLRMRHMEEALDRLQEDLLAIDRSHDDADRVFMEQVTAVIGRQDAGSFVQAIRPSLLCEELPVSTLRQCIHLLLLVLQRDRQTAAALLHSQ
jgi:hypothetical protein